MKSFKNVLLLIAIMVMSTSEQAVAMDARTFSLEFSHNKQDEQGNTFWHQLALNCNDCDDWGQVQQMMDLFKQNNKNWLPNPLIENKKGNTAQKEAKVNFKQSGNPVCGLLVIYLRQSEEGYLNKIALKQNRELMKFAQHIEHPNK